MTVGELIEELKQYDPALEVVNESDCFVIEYTYLREDGTETDVRIGS